MNELFDVKDTDCKILIQGKERQIKFGMSAWAKLEDKYGNIQNIEKIENELDTMPIHTILSLCWIGLQDKDGLSEETFLDEYSMADVEQLGNKIVNALMNSLPQTEEKKTTTM